MKKIFTLLFAAVLAVGAYANEQVVMADSIKGVMAVELEQYPGIAQIMWSADSTKSFAYYLEVGAYDPLTKKQTVIGYIFLRSTDFPYPGQPGYFLCNTQFMLSSNVCSNYPNLIARGASEAQAAPFKEGWENYVDASDYTLAAGYYYIIVAGYDSTLRNITEVQKAIVVNLVGKPEAIENIFESTKPVKFMENGQVRILRDGKVYDMSGALVR